MKKRMLFLSGLMWMCCMFHATAQDRRGRISPDEFVRRMESFIVREACLSPAEANAFFPVFHEMRKKQQSVNWKIRELKRRALPAKASDKDYYNIIKEITNLKVECAEVEEVYYKKMCKVVPARKVYDAMKAEDAFHRSMLSKFGKSDARRKGK